MQGHQRKSNQNQLLADLSKNYDILEAHNSTHRALGIW